MVSAAAVDCAGARELAGSATGIAAHASLGMGAFEDVPIPTGHRNADQLDEPSYRDWANADATNRIRKTCCPAYMAARLSFRLKATLNSVVHCLARALSCPPGTGTKSDATASRRICIDAASLRALRCSTVATSRNPRTKPTRVMPRAPFSVATTAMPSVLSTRASGVPGGTPRATTCSHWPSRASGGISGGRTLTFTDSSGEFHSTTTRCVRSDENRSRHQPVGTSTYIVSIGSM
jgi:hypothetical protein